MFPFRRRKDVPVLDASKIPSGSMNPPPRGRGQMVVSTAMIPPASTRPPIPPPDAGVPREERTPDYVHKILDNLIHGDPLNFEGCRVPLEVQERLMWAVSMGKLIEIPGGMTRGLG